MKEIFLALGYESALLFPAIGDSTYDIGICVFSNAS
jgi:hypothetical protein